MTTPVVDPTTTLRSYLLTAEQQKRSQLLGVEQQAGIETSVTALTQELADIRFVGSHEDRMQIMLQHAYIQGRRDSLQELLTACAAAYSDLPESLT